MKLQLLIIIILTLFTCTSCEGDIFIEEAQQMVIEGYMEDSLFPVVMVTKTIPVSRQYQQIDQLDDYVVKWAKVCVIHDNDTTILTGMPNKNYFPPYIYTTSHLRGQSGETYKLTVDFKGSHAESIVTIPPAINLDSIWTEPVDDESERYIVKAQFKDNPDTKDYYLFYVNDSMYTEMFFPSQLALLDDSLCNGQIKQVNIIKGYSSSSEVFNPYYLPAEEVVVKFSHITKEAFLFWQKYLELQNTSRNFILSTYQELPTNILGSIGYFHAQSVHFYKLQIPGIQYTK